MLNLTSQQRIPKVKKHTASMRRKEILKATITRLNVCELSEPVVACLCRHVSMFSFHRLE